MKSTLLSLGVTLGITALATPVIAAEAATKPVSDKKLGDFNVGEIISGEKVDVKAMSGKVVVLEFWGRNCGPCLASMPHLDDLAKRYKSKGLQVIGVHSQDGTDEEILEAVKNTKAKFPIARNGSSPISFSGIPKMFVFNTKGEVVYDGHPMDAQADRIIKKELRNVTAAGDSKSGSISSTSAGTGTTAGATTAGAGTGASALIAERTWTSSEGRTMIAALLSVDDTGIGKFKRKDGVLFDLPLSRLGEADRKLVDEAKFKKNL